MDLDPVYVNRLFLAAATICAGFIVVAVAQVADVMNHFPITITSGAARLLSGCSILGFVFMFFEFLQDDKFKDIKYRNLYRWTTAFMIASAIFLAVFVPGKIIYAIIFGILYCRFMNRANHWRWQGLR